MTTATPTSSQQARSASRTPTRRPGRGRDARVQHREPRARPRLDRRELDVLRADRRPRARHHGPEREPASRTMAIWGIVLNAVMLAGTVLFALIAIVGLAFLPFAFL